MAAYPRSIVCDIDDTVSFCTNRDWENAVPNTLLIAKLNSLYDNGWEVNYYTARGTLSCSSRDDASTKYRNGIELWFKKNNVKYHKLSFDKPLASYYIDDKAITPEGFLDLDIEIMHGGLSGAQIERRGTKVYKTHSNSLEVAQWYKEASNIIKSVKVHSMVGDTLCIDFIESTNEPRIDQIEFIINKFSTVPSFIPFSTYKARVYAHLELHNADYTKEVQQMMRLYEEFYNENKSFSHGDMSLDNMINSNDILYLIDPNHPKDLYSSYLLDVSKVMQSAKRFNRTHVYDYFANKYSSYIKEIKLLELTHWVRMIKYEKPENINNIDNMIRNLLKEIQC